MNNNEFYKAFSRRSGMPYHSGEAVCRDVLSFLSEQISVEDKVEIRGLGVFKKETDAEGNNIVTFKASANPKRFMPAPMGAATAIQNLDHNVVDIIRNRGIEALFVQFLEAIAATAAPKAVATIPPAKKNRVCQHCGETFLPHHHSQKFCGKECANAVKKAYQKEYAAKWYRRMKEKKIAISAPGVTINL